MRFGPRMLEMPSLDVNLRFENLITSEEDFTIMLSRKSTIFNGLLFVLMLKRSNSTLLSTVVIISQQINQPCKHGIKQYIKFINLITPNF
jgi:hypothetical protein